MRWFVFSLGFLFFTCQHGSTSTWQTSSSILVQMSQKAINPDSIWLLIDKSDYSLQIRYQDSLCKTYAVAFGSDPVADKLRQGDMRTPEGVFSIRDAYPHDKWQYFLWLDYPTEDSWKKHNAAKSSGEIPANASIGGEIGIHGIPKGYDDAIRHRRNWTLGCISMTSSDISELYQLVGKGTRVVIQP